MIVILKRIPTILKKIGLTVVFYTTLNSTTAYTQIFWHKHHGNVVSNFVYQLSWEGANDIELVDIDNDGDLDCFSSIDKPSNLSIPTPTTNAVRYYENTGSSFVLQSSPFYPFNSSYLASPKFADIDNDGDLDCFVTEYDLFNYQSNIIYYENQGNASNPTFVKHTGIANPLDTLNKITSNPSVWFDNAHKTLSMSFVDIDNDSDLDLFYNNAGYLWSSHSSSRPADLLYLENVGTSTVPTYVPDSLNNPLNNLFAEGYLLTGNPNNDITGVLPVTDMNFVDVDNDDDYDLLAFYRDTSLSNTQPNVKGQMELGYFRNIGTKFAPNFIQAPSNNNPFALFFSNITPSKINGLHLGDLSNDTDLDILIFEDSTGTFNPGKGASEALWFENIYIIQNTYLEQKSREISISPNPAYNYSQLSQPITGQALLYDLYGKEIWHTNLEESTLLNWPLVEEGIYFLFIKTEKKTFTKRLIINH